MEESNGQLFLSNCPLAPFPVRGPAGSVILAYNSLPGGGICDLNAFANTIIVDYTAVLYFLVHFYYNNRALIHSSILSLQMET